MNITALDLTLCLVKEHISHRVINEHQITTFRSNSCFLPREFGLLVLITLCHALLLNLQASAALGRALMGTLLVGAMKGNDESVQVPPAKL